MTITAKVILDSIAPNGARLTTFELTYPRFIHSELMTHRAFSRNAASSRAIPTPSKISRIRKDVARPSEWGVNQKGMVASGPLSPEDVKLAEAVWGEACHNALKYGEILCGLRCENCELYIEHENENACNKCVCGGSQIVLDLHKQVANRILEPFDHITVVLSTTKINNHFLLRLATDLVTGRPLADPTYFELATKWKAAFDASTPYKTKPGEWHLPYVSRDVGCGVRLTIADDQDIVALRALLPDVDWSRDPLSSVEMVGVLKMVSAARCARVSYMRQGQGDIAENKMLHDRLVSGGHWAPLEHVATPMSGFKFRTHEDSDPDDCAYCRGDLGSKFVAMSQTDRGGGAICMKCAHGHVHSGNFHGWHQYRKEFAGEAGGD